MEFALAGLTALVLLYHAYEARAWRDERTELLNRLMARTPGEYRMLQTTPPHPHVAGDPTEDHLRGRDEHGRLDGAWSL